MGHPGSYWAEATYTYYVWEYRAGKCLRSFRREKEADEFIRQIQDKKVQIHFKESDPNTSTIVDRDLEMIAPICFSTR
jgi:hypothetical protein